MEDRVNTSPEIQLSAGTIKYEDTGGSGPVILFVHGLLASGMLWAPVVPLLSGEARCIVPELPLGAHEEPMNPDAELSPPLRGRAAGRVHGQARPERRDAGGQRHRRRDLPATRDRAPRARRPPRTDAVRRLRAVLPARVQAVAVGVEGAGRAELRAAARPDPRSAQQPARVRLAVQARHPG